MGHIFLYFFLLSGCMLCSVCYLFVISSGGACFPLRWCELLVGRPLVMCAQCRSSILASRPVPLVDDPYPYRPYPIRAEDFYIRLHWMGDFHNPISSQIHGPFIPLPSRPKRTGKLQAVFSLSNKKLIRSIGAVDCLGRLVSEINSYVSSGTLNPTD